MNSSLRNFRRVAVVTALSAMAVVLSSGLPANMQFPVWASPARDPAPGHHLVAAPGLVEPIGEEREVGSQVIGIIQQMRIDENDEVRAGQIIAVVDNAEQVARLASARAELALREAELERTLNGARVEERREARATLDEAEANLDMARRDYARRLPLTISGTSPQSALDLATSTLHASEARRAVAAERLALIEAGSRAEDIAAARAQVDLARANVALAEALLDKTFIHSPIAGTVLRRERVAGEAVTNVPPTPIAIIGDLHRLRVRAEVDETDVGRVSVGEPVAITADAFPDQKFSGTVYRVLSRMGPKEVQTGRPADKVDTKVLQVLIDLDPGAKLPVGLRVDAFFGSDEPSAVNRSATGSG
ncbi:MAG TPA: efflux RND transporter periplasmic adaptor subunit [Bradyrhizobium sp.]|uniref:HlyD family secretion protein n=1 Tax=Bradyrhizobium sp. TaxID=376 RepID=UPI002BAF65AD|nr:efflux RND transporter periplasmic adaptor subunit [Bradyrhizobium sp.]HLZ04183.1 efflux RND transporter periplasmic adaptor subunit [Bradyrhizobium sp.]